MRGCACAPSAFAATHLAIGNPCLSRRVFPSVLLHMVVVLQQPVRVIGARTDWLGAQACWRRCARC